MYQWAWRATIFASVAVAQVGFSASECQGGIVLDWLFGSREQVVYYPVYPPTGVVANPLPDRAVMAYAPTAPSFPVRGMTAYRPLEPAYAAQATGYNGPAVVANMPTQSGYYSQPTVAYRAAPMVAPEASACCGQEVVVNRPAPSVCFSAPTVAYRVAPQTTSFFQPRYRTSWQQIPVTVYRPVTTPDPITGCAVTVMKPCTTYTWQAERRRCGFFRRLFGRCDPPPPSTTVVASPGVPSCCSEGPAMAPSWPTAPTPAPYYEQGSVAAPGTGTLVPGSYPGGGTSLEPQTPLPSGAATPSPTDPRAPANTRPSLKPTSEPPIEPTASDPLSSTDPWNLAPANASRTRATVPLPASRLETSRPTRNRPLRLSPVPDPDATPATPHEDLAPQLLDPRDQTASLGSGHAWAYTAIAWPNQPVRHAAVLQVPPRNDPTPDEVWNERGWRSVGR